MRLLMRVENSRGYALMLALLPVVMMYKVPILGLGVSTCLIAGGMVFCGLILCRRYKKIQFRVITPLLLYLLYTMTRSSTYNLLLSLAVLTHIVTISTGAVDSDYLKKTVVTISICAAIGVIVQRFVKLVFGIHIPMIIYNWCLESLDYYKQAILYGIPRHESIYRPSAFFLEPSHLTMYCIVGLSICLIKEKTNYTKAFIISLGVIFTTSGMGIVLVAAVWCAYSFLKDRFNFIKFLKRGIVLLIVAAISILILSRLPFFQSTLARIVGPVEHNANQYNAIWGRTLYWERYIGPMHGDVLFWGYGKVSPPDDYFTGWMTIIYHYGVVGLILMYIAIAHILIRCREISLKLVLAIYGVMLPLADLRGFINLIFYFGLFVSCCSPGNEKVIIEEKTRSSR